MRNNWPFIVLIVISALALYLNVGSYGVIESSDARYAEIAREMYTSGDYLHPNLLNIHHYHKPPITYQITAVGYQIFGVNAFGARFFLQLAVLIQLLLVYALGRLLFNSRQTALWAAAIYFSFPLVLVSSRNLTTDAFLTTFALLSMYAWVKYRKENLKGYLYIFTLSLAMGFLTKGPVIFIVPVPFILAYNSFEKSKSRYTIHHLLAWILFLALASSWYVYLVVQNPEFLDYFLGRQTVDRFSKDAFDRTEPFWYFIVLAPAAGIPWLLFLPWFLTREWKNLKLKSVYGPLMIGIVVPLIFFSISSSKRILYILPFYCILALLTSYLLANLSEKGTRRLSRVMLVFAMLLSLVLVSGFFLPTPYRIPNGVAILGLISLPLLLWIYHSGLISSGLGPVLMSFLMAVVFLISSSMIMASNELAVNSPAPVSDFILEHQIEGREILVYNTRKPSIAFGLDRSIISLDDGSKDLAREIQFEPDESWKNYLLDMQNPDELEKLKALMEQPTVLLIYRNPLPEKHRWMLDHYENREVMDMWEIYY